MEITSELKNNPFSFRLRLLFLKIKLENITTATSQLGHDL